MLQYQVARWDGRPGEGVNLDRPLEDLVAAAEDADDGTRSAAYLLEAYRYYKAGNPFCQEYAAGPRMGRLEWVSERRDPYGAAAHFLLGRLLCTLADEKRLSDRFRDLKLAFSHFEKINEEVPLPRSILLPGIRIEAPARALHVLDGGDPLTEVVPVPWRYRAAVATAVAECARYARRPKKEIGKYLAKADEACSSPQASPGGNKYITWNIRLCKAVAALNHAGQNRGRRESARKGFDDLLTTLYQGHGRAGIPNDKYFEWTASCYAGLAYLAPTKRAREDHLNQMLSYVSRSLMALRTRSHPFGIDPLYELAIGADEDLRDYYRQLLRSRGLPLQLGLAESSPPRVQQHIEFHAPAFNPILHGPSLWEEHVSGNKYEFKDVHHAIITLDSTLTQVNQAIGESSIGPKKDELRALLEELKNVLAKVPADKAEDAGAVADAVKDTVDKIAKPQPNKRSIEISTKGILAAAAQLAEALPIAKKIGSTIAAMFGFTV
jgi:hypothetical protein